MSVNGPGQGQYGGYTPPPPSMNGMPRKGRSPWVYVGLGCGGLAVLAFGGCVAAIMVVGNKMKQPLTDADISHSMGDVPRYPGAAVDMLATKGARMVMPAVEKSLKVKDGGGVAFTTTDPYAKVESWYETKLTKQGFTQAPPQGEVTMFQNKSEIVGIQAMQGNSIADEAGKSKFLIMRFPQPPKK